MPRHIAHQSVLPLQVTSGTGPVKFRALPLDHRQTTVRNHIGKVLGQLDKTHRKLCHAALTQEVWAVLNAGVHNPDEALQQWLTEWLQPDLAKQTELDLPHV